MNKNCSPTKSQLTEEKLRYAVTDCDVKFFSDGEIQQILENQRLRELLEEQIKNKRNELEFVESEQLKRKQSFEYDMERKVKNMMRLESDIKLLQSLLDKAKGEKE